MTVRASAMARKSSAIDSLDVGRMCDILTAINMESFKETDE